MICPVELASDLSALPAAGVRDHARHGKLLEERDGADHESAGSDFAGDSEEDHVVAGNGEQQWPRQATRGKDRGQPWRVR